MRIAIFSDNFYPELSGISDSIITTTKELAKRGHSINFYVPQYSARDYKIAGVKQKELDLGKNIDIIRFSSLHFPTGTGQGRAIVPTGLRYLKVKKFQPDIIHTQLFFGVGLEALFASKILKKPLVGTNHTAVTEFVRYVPLHNGWLADLMLKYVNWYYERCVLTTAPSHSVVSEMQHFGFQGESHVVSNPVDTDTFRSLGNKNWLRKKFNLAENTIVHAGRLSQERNVDVIIKSLVLVHKKFPATELAIAGKGVNENKLKKLAESLGIAEKVKFLGFVSQPILAEIYNASKIFAITSTSDTQSMVMMQAMAAGLPIIGVKARALPEYINPKNGFLIEPGDEKALAEKIIFLLEKPDVRKKLSQGARNFACKFSISEIATIWEQIYENLINDYNKKYKNENKFCRAGS